jgi:hypothetical protein
LLLSDAYRPSRSITGVSGLKSGLGYTIMPGDAWVDVEHATHRA